VPCSLAEEETRLVAKATGGFDAPTYKPVSEALRVVLLARSEQSFDLTPGYVPPADRLRAVLPVGTNRAP